MKTRTRGESVNTATAGREKIVVDPHTTAEHVSVRGIGVDKDESEWQRSNNFCSAVYLAISCVMWAATGALALFIYYSCESENADLTECLAFGVGDLVMALLSALNTWALISECRKAVMGIRHPAYAEYRYYRYQACRAYRIGRENGRTCDNPPYPFPGDGKYSECVDAGTIDQPGVPAYHSWVYTEGPGDKAWMQQKDRNYVFRLLRAGTLDSTEPNLASETPILSQEVDLERLKLSTKEETENVAEAEKELDARSSDSKEEVSIEPSHSSTLIVGGNRSALFHSGAGSFELTKASDSQHQYLQVV